MHMIHPEPKQRNALVCLVGYLRVEKKKCIIVRNPKFLKMVMFCDTNYATSKETRNSVRGLVAAIGETQMMCSSKNQRANTLGSM